MNKIPFRHFHDQDGFTLLEIMVALAIFSIGILGFYSLQLVTISGNASAVRTTTATTWGADQIEKIISLKYDNDDLKDDNDDGDAGLDNTSSPDGQAISDDGLYTVIWNVAEGTPMRNVKTIRIISRKTSGIGSDKNVMLTFYKTKEF